MSVTNEGDDTARERAAEVDEYSGAEGVRTLAAAALSSSVNFHKHEKSCSPRVNRREMRPKDSLSAMQTLQNDPNRELVRKERMKRVMNRQVELDRAQLLKQYNMLCKKSRKREMRGKQKGANLMISGDVFKNFTENI